MRETPILDPANWRKLRLRCEKVARAGSTLIVNDRLLKTHFVDFDLMPAYFHTIAHAHSTYELIVVLEGNARYEGWEKEQMIGRGHVLLFGPQAKHAWRVTELPCTTFVVFFSAEPAIAVPLPEEWPVDPDLVDEVERLEQDLLDSNPNDLFAPAVQVMGIVNRGLTLISPDKPLLRQVTSQPDLMEEIQQLLLQDISHPLTLKEIAAHVGMSVRHLTRTFHEESGGTITEHILACRFRVARSLLRESNEKIAEISARAGFSDQCYFTRAFHRYFNMTPNEYRKSARQHAQQEDEHLPYRSHRTREP